MLVIRKATIADIDLIRELTFKIWPATYGHLLTQEQIDYMLDMMYSPASLQKQLLEDGCTFIIVKDNNIEVGFASYNEIEHTKWKLNKLYVLPIQQGKGTGKQVINYIVDEIKQLQATTLQLQVNRDNSARYFYEKLGFTNKYEADFDIGNGYFMNDYIMELVLTKTPS